MTTPLQEFIGDNTHEQTLAYTECFAHTVFAHIQGCAQISIVGADYIYDLPGTGG